MKGKIVGVNPYTKKDTGAKRANVWVIDDKVEPIFGFAVRKLNCDAKLLPDEPQKMVNQVYYIDTDGGFANEFTKLS